MAACQLSNTGFTEEVVMRKLYHDSEFNVSQARSIYWGCNENQAV